ncbi:MAG: multicopper oxidase domain-containing protein [Paracoccaceae bacterium]
MLAAPAGDTTLTLQTLLYETGGDAWPPATLGHVTFTGAGTDIAALSTTDFTRPAVPESFREGAAPFRESPFTQAQCRSGGLRVLGEGEKRRIYFAILEDDGEERFLLGHTVIGADGSETDERGQPVTEPVLRPFDMMRTAADLCVLGGPGAKDETWQLVNISHEVHNFHIHQGKFSLVCEPGVEPCRMRFHPVSDVDKVNLANAVAFAEGKQQEIGAMIHDTIIVPRGRATAADPHRSKPAAPRPPRAASCNGSRISTGPPGLCLPARSGLLRRADARSPRRFRMPAGSRSRSRSTSPPYSLGKYVFHCHILEHEDLGMMAAIRVLDPSQMDVMADAGAGMGDAPRRRWITPRMAGIAGTAAATRRRRSTT